MTRAATTSRLATARRSRSREYQSVGVACRCPQVGGSQARAEEIRRPYKCLATGTYILGLSAHWACNGCSGCFVVAPIAIRSAARHGLPLGAGLRKDAEK